MSPEPVIPRAAAVMSGRVQAMPSAAAAVIGLGAALADTDQACLVGEDDRL